MSDWDAHSRNLGSAESARISQFMQGQEAGRRAGRQDRRDLLIDTAILAGSVALWQHGRQKAAEWWASLSPAEQWSHVAAVSARSARRWGWAAVGFALWGMGGIWEASRWTSGGIFANLTLWGIAGLCLLVSKARQKRAANARVMLGGLASRADAGDQPAEPLPRARGDSGKFVPPVSAVRPGGSHEHEHGAFGWHRHSSDNPFHGHDRWSSA